MTSPFTQMSATNFVGEEKYIAGLPDVQAWSANIDGIVPLVGLGVHESLEVGKDISGGTKQPVFEEMTGNADGNTAKVVVVVLIKDEPDKSAMVPNIPVKQPDDITIGSVVLGATKSLDKKRLRWMNWIRLLFLMTLNGGGISLLMRNARKLICTLWMRLIILRNVCLLGSGLVKNGYVRR